MCKEALIIGRGNICALKDDFDWLFNKMLDTDRIVLVSPIFESDTISIVHTITGRIGPRMDRGINETAKKIAQATGDKAPDECIFKDKFISFMGIGGSNWGSLVQMDHAMLPCSPCGRSWIITGSNGLSKSLQMTRMSPVLMR